MEIHESAASAPADGVRASVELTADDEDHGLGVNDGRPFLHGMHQGFFELLPFLPAGRMLDVGAAVGHYTKVMRQFSPASPVTAFEPFPGNVPHFKKTVGDDPGVTLIQKAVMDYDGTASFHVPSIVSTDLAHWSQYAGFSSLGAVVAADDPRETITVETCKIDSVVDEHVVAMKIDVQGAELAVLRGASKLFAGRGVDFLYLEFTGEEDILNFVLDAGYRVYTSHYVVFIREKPNLAGWNIDSERELSTGRKTLFGWPKQPPHDPHAFCEFFIKERRHVGALVTDLVCVHTRVLALFESAAFMTQLNADFEIRAVS